MEKLHLLSIPFTDWEGLFTHMNCPAYRMKQVREWIFTHLQGDFNNMSNLPLDFRKDLTEKFILFTLDAVEEKLSLDGTVKWVFRTSDEKLIECVMVPEGKRRSICLSSQVGCAMGCRFCSTAKMGFIRNLTLGEILEQVHYVNRYLKNSEGSRITNVIFMGMGEPLSNLDAVADACKIISGKNGFNLSKQKITVSTSGIAPQIYKWAEKAPEFKLAISLNGSNNSVRLELMPGSRRCSLEQVLEAAKAYTRITDQQITFEYVLIRNKTCTPQAAGELKKIASQMKCKINLIVLNEGGPGNYQAPLQSEILKFQEILFCSNFTALLRKSRGCDISAACGQLVQQQKKVA
jgi:23S rRNA (adenine2503-C2)-methyltransferase